MRSASPLQDEARERDCRQKSDQPERNGDVDVEGLAGADAEHRDEADGDGHQHVEREHAIRQGRADDDPDDGQQQGKASTPSAAVSAQSSSKAAAVIGKPP